jgi:hypothetical protein
LEKGVLIDANKLGAIRWYRKAEKQGVDWTKGRIIQIKRRMKRSS